MDVNEEYNKRRKEANDLLLKALKSVDPKADSSGVYADIAQLYRELNTDIHNEMEAVLKERELELMKEKMDSEERARELADLTERLKIAKESESKAKSDETERIKIESEAKVKTAAIEAEKARTATEAKTEQRKAYLDIAGKVIIGVGTVFTGITQIWMFARSTEKEQDEALLTQTSQTVVRNGLSGKLFK